MSHGFTQDSCTQAEGIIHKPIDHGCLALLKAVSELLVLIYVAFSRLPGASWEEVSLCCVRF